MIVFVVYNNKYCNLVINEIKYIYMLNNYYDGG